jgi:predicted membrane channel-forming protein YqfA (hemolysin III family)
MRKRTRKLIGTALILGFVVIYGPVAMALADSRIAQAPELVQTLAYLVLGLIWILPLLPLIRWMEKPDPDGA